MKKLLSFLLASSLVLATLSPVLSASQIEPANKIAVLDRASCELVSDLKIQDKVASSFTGCGLGADLGPTSAIDLTKLVGLRPDLILVSDFNADITENLKGQRILYLGGTDLRDLYNRIMYLGQATHTEKRVENMANSLGDFLEKYLDQTPETVLIFLSVDPPVLLTTAHFVSHGLYYIGLLNPVQADTPLVMADAEMLKEGKVQPDYIFILETQQEAFEAVRKDWSGMKAVKKDRVAFLPLDFFMRYGYGFQDVLLYFHDQHIMRQGQFVHSGHPTHPAK